MNKQESLDFLEKNYDELEVAKLIKDLKDKKELQDAREKIRPFLEGEKFEIRDGGLNSGDDWNISIFKEDAIKGMELIKKLSQSELVPPLFVTESCFVPSARTSKAWRSQKKVFVDSKWTVSVHHDFIDEMNNMFRTYFVIDGEFFNIMVGTPRHQDLRSEITYLEDPRLEECERSTSLIDNLTGLKPYKGYKSFYGEQSATFYLF